MADPHRVAVDTCVLIDWLTNTDDTDRLNGALWLLKAHERGEVRLVLPALVIAEVCGSPVMRPPQASQRQARAERVERFLTWVRDSRVLVVDIDQRIAERGARLAQAHQLKGGDAVVLSAAMAAHCTDLYTWDKGLLKVHGHADIGPLQVAGPVPIEPAQAELAFPDDASEAGS